MRKIESDYQIKHDDTLCSLFGEAEDRDHSALKKNETYKAFQEKMRIIHRVGTYNNICAGIILLMVTETYFFDLGHCPWGMFNDVHQFVKKNISNWQQILDSPERLKRINKHYEANNRHNSTKG